MRYIGIYKKMLNLRMNIAKKYKRLGYYNFILYICFKIEGSIFLRYLESNYYFIN